MTKKSCPICGNQVEEALITCDLCGYRFAEGTQKFKPVSLDAEPTPATQPAEQPTLRVIRGPQTGVSYKLEKLVSSVGRQPKCDIFLNDMTVSREHALIAATEKGYVISDRNSYNGLWINNKAVDSAVLKTGDVIQIGEFCLLFEA